MEMPCIRTCGRNRPRTVPHEFSEDESRLFAQSVCRREASDPIVKLIAIARPAVEQGSRTEINGCGLAMGSRLQRIDVRQGGRVLYHQARQSARCIGAGVDIDTVSPDLDFETGRVAMYDCLAKILV